MKLPSLADARRPGNPGMARTAALFNQFATPGLGSLLAGKWLAGAGQLFLACAGFLLLMVWFVQVMVHYYRLIDSTDVGASPSNWTAVAGAVVFLLAWLWSLVTSIQLINEARRDRLLPPLPGDPHNPPK
jgi:hypothetical protein